MQMSHEGVEYLQLETQYMETKMFQTINQYISDSPGFLISFTLPLTAYLLASPFTLQAPADRAPHTPQFRSQIPSKTPSHLTVPLTDPYRPPHTSQISHRF